MIRKANSKKFGTKNNIQLWALKVPTSKDFWKLARQKPLRQIQKLQPNVNDKFPKKMIKELFLQVCIGMWWSISCFIEIRHETKDVMRVKQMYTYRTDVELEFHYHRTYCSESDNPTAPNQHGDGHKYPWRNGIRIRGAEVKRLTLSTVQFLWNFMVWNPTLGAIWMKWEFRWRSKWTIVVNRVDYQYRIIWKIDEYWPF